MLTAGTVVRVRLNRTATSISLLVVIGVSEDGQKVWLAVKNMGGETTEAWRAVLDDLIARGLRPQFLIVDGAPGLEKELAAIWDGVPHNAARFTSIGTCSLMLRSGCTRRSWPAPPT